MAMNDFSNLIFLFLIVLGKNVMQWFFLLAGMEKNH